MSLQAGVSAPPCSSLLPCRPAVLTCWHKWVCGCKVTWSEKLLLLQNHYFLPLIFHLCQFPIGECHCGLSTTVHMAVQDQLFQSQALAFLASDICPARAPVPTAFAHSPSLSVSPLLTVFFLGRHSLKHMVYASAFTAWYHPADCEGCRVWRKDWTLRWLIL